MVHHIFTELNIFVYSLYEAPIIIITIVVVFVIIIIIMVAVIIMINITILLLLNLRSLRLHHFEISCFTRFSSPIHHFSNKTPSYSGCN